MTATDATPAAAEVPSPFAEPTKLVTGGCFLDVDQALIAAVLGALAILPIKTVR